MKYFSHLQKVVATGVLVMLGGCEVGPDYTKPDTTLPSAWISEPTSDSRLQVDQQWWKNFNDPILCELIEKSSANNFDLKMAEARIAEARAQVSSATTTLFPTGDVKGAATREANQFAFPGGADSPFTSLLHKPFNFFQTGFDASWELDLFGGNRRGEEAAEAQMQASEASRDDIRVSMLAEVARTYIDIRGLQAQLATAHDIIMADKKTLSIAQQRFQAGEAPRLDVTQAEASLEQAQGTLPQIHNQLIQTEYSMDVLLGEQPGVTQGIVATPFSIPTVPKDLPLTTPASAIAQRPDIRVAERKLASATAQQGVAVAKFFPNISLNGFFGALNTSVNNLATPTNQSWLASGSIVWPIFNYGTLSANLDAANAQQQEAMANYQKTLLSALSDVEKSLNAYNEQQKFIQSKDREVDKDIHARDIALERYRAGMTSFLAVLDTERTLYDAQNQLIKARADYVQDVVALYKSLGGGWSQTSRPI